MQEFYNDIYKSFRDSVEEFYSQEGEYVETDELVHYYNAYIENYVAQTNNYLFDEVVEMKEKRIKFNEDLLLEIQNAVLEMGERPTIPEVPAGAISLDDVLDKAYKKCIQDVKEEGVIKNEIEYFMDELEECGIDEELYHDNLYGLEESKAFRDSIISIYRQERIRKNIASDERI